MYYQTYMAEYYQKNKEKSIKQSLEWRKNNPDNIKIIQGRYRKKHKADRDYRDEKIKILPFKKRISKECLARMKENTKINRKLVKHYEWQEDWLPKKRILEGV